VTRRLLMLVGSVAALWLLLGLPARHFGGGDDALMHSGAAALLCTLPMAVSLAVVTRLARTNPQMQAIGILGASGVRMIFVLAAALALAGIDPFFGQPAFWMWLVVFYCATLALDVGLLLADGARGPAN
jgi:hypothetical protein